MLYTTGFVLLTLGCGTLMTFRRCDELDAIERLALRFGVGTALGPTVVILLYEVLRLRVHPLTVLVLGTVGLVLMVLDERRRAERAATSTSATWVVGSLTAGTLAATLWGALRHPGFGGRDPWHHALGTAWLLAEGRLRQPFPDWPLIHYVDGYPPSFDITLALAAAPFKGDIVLPLKMAAAVFAAASVLAVYFLGRRLIGTSTGGTLAAVLYAVAPGALGRHVWGHSQAVVLIITGLACAVELQRSRRLLPAAAICFGGAVLAAPSQGVKGLALAVLTAAVALASNAGWGRRLLVALAAAVVVASAWFVPLLARTGLEPTSVFSSMDSPELRRTGARWSDDAPDLGGWANALRGSENRRYDLDDILFFRPHVAVQPLFGPKRINFIVPEGVGAPVLALALIGLLFASKSGDPSPATPRRALAGLWLLVTALGVAGASTGLNFYTWRFWMLIVPIASVAAAMGVIRLSEPDRPSISLVIAAAIATVLAVSQLILALITDAAAGLWRFWVLNPSFALVAGAGLVFAGLMLIHSRGATARLAALLVVLHIVIASPARLRAISFQVESNVFADRFETEGYLSIADVTPPGSTIFPLSGGSRCAAVVGINRVCRPWDPGWHELDRLLAERPCEVSPAALVPKIRSLGADYLVIDSSFRRRLEQQCGGSDRFRSTIVDLLNAPGTSLVLSHPPAEEPSHSRVVVLSLGSRP